jgi:hypothetical protein
MNELGELVFGLLVCQLPNHLVELKCTRIQSTLSTLMEVDLHMAILRSLVADAARCSRCSDLVLEASPKVEDFLHLAVVVSWLRAEKMSFNQKQSMSNWFACGRTEYTLIVTVVNENFLLCILFVSRLVRSSCLFKPSTGRHMGRLATLPHSAQPGNVKRGMLSLAHSTRVQGGL